MDEKRETIGDGEPGVTPVNTPPNIEQTTGQAGPTNQGDGGGNDDGTPVDENLQSGRDIGSDR